MVCFIYKSQKKLDTYLYVTNKDDYQKVPEALLANLGQLEFVMELALVDDQKLAQADVEQVKQQLTEKGYFLQLPPANVVH